MNYYSIATKEDSITTAIYPNRLKDKLLVEEIIGLYEFGSNNLVFKTLFDTEISNGYLRILYGDHGPYIEFLKKHINWLEFECVRKNIGYYDKWYPIDGSDTLLYYQTKNVKNLPNPPIGGFFGNRKDGYADYRIGRLYISVFDIKI